MPDSRFRSRCAALLSAMVCVLPIAPAASASRSSGRAAAPARAGSSDYFKRADINSLSMVVSNIGSFGYDVAIAGPGLEYPKGSGKTLMFAGGLWLGAKVNGATRVAVAEYESEFGPGPITGGIPADPSDPTHVVYKLNRVNPDLGALAAYQAGAVPYGAPPVTVLPDNTLDIPGDQMLWCVYNDANPALHTSRAGQTAPLGVEVQQTTYAYDDPGPLGSTIYMTYRIINKSANTLDTLHVGLWADPDLGGSSDDLAGSDAPGLLLGYAYNGTNNDAVYGSQTPALGLEFVGWDHPVYPSFAAYGNGTDPTSAEETYLWLHGRLPNGQPILPYGFMFDGDPVQGTGSLDLTPQDRRILLSAGRATMAPGDTITMTWAVVVGQQNDRISSVARLKCHADLIKDFWVQRALDPPRPPPYSCPWMPSCPRSAGWWLDQCGVANDFTASQMDTIARRIDGRAKYFDWSANPFSGFCQTFLGAETDRTRAEREFASLLANLACGPVQFFPPLIPQSGHTVSLNDVPISCDGLDANNISQLAQTSTDGFRGGYLDTLPHPTPITFSANTGYSFFYSSLEPTTDPDSFPRVELRFGQTQIAHRFLRFETATGSVPTGIGSRMYLHSGHFSVPFTAWDVDHDVQLQVGFTERVVVDDDGTIQPSAFQPASFDSSWSPDTTASGGHEYVLVFSYPYGADKEAELTAPEALYDGLPLLYGMQPKRVTTSSEFDPGDQFFFEWGAVGTSVDALMRQLADLPPAQANPVYQQIYACLNPINRGIGIGATCDYTVAVLISLIEASRGADGISVAWYASEAVSVTVERRVDSGGWVQVASRLADGSGRIRYQDRDVSDGHRYSYRLRYRDEHGERIAGETSVDLASTARTDLVGFVPNPARGRPGVFFSLASDRPATLAIHDVAGRRVGSYQVGHLGRGTHLLPLEPSSLASGVYLLRLTQDGRTVTARSALVR